MMMKTRAMIGFSLSIQNGRGWELGVGSWEKGKGVGAKTGETEASRKGNWGKEKEKEKRQ